MAILLEEQWEIDGYVFGGNGNHRKPVFLLHSGLDYGASGIRSQDAARAGADGSLMGRDYIDPPEYQFTMGLEGPDVWEVYERLARAWRPANRTQPGWTSTLRYMRNGRTYRMFGRPRKLGIKPAVNKNDQFQIVEATFQLSEPMMYRETNQGANTATLRLIAPDSGSGVTFPVAVPVEWRDPNPVQSNGITVASTVPTPFEVWIKGPVTGTLSNIKLSGSGWKLETSATVAYDQTLYINTRTQVIQRNGVNIPGTLSANSRLSARLQPGMSTVTFSGTDPSATATARFSWYDTISL